MNPNQSYQNDGSVRLQIWDTAGAERFRALAHMYYKDAKAIIVAFSLVS